MDGRQLEPERFDTVVVGGGQAGLATGYYLARLGRPFVILDAGQRTGDAWRNRWDSLRLFTPSRYSGLPGMGFEQRPIRVVASSGTTGRPKSVGITPAVLSRRLANGSFTYGGSALAGSRVMSLMGFSTLMTRRMNVAAATP